MKMEISDFKWVLLLRLVYIVNASYYDQYYEPSNNQESNSQENTSDMDQKTEHRHSMPSNRNDMNNYNNSPKPPMQQQVPGMPLPQMPSMSMAMQVPMTMQVPQSQSQAMPQMPIQMSQMGMQQMPQMPQMPMQSMPMPQMPIPSIPMPPMPMPMLPMQMPMPAGPFGGPMPGQFSGSGLIYFPMASQFTDFLKNIIPPKPSPLNELSILPNFGSGTAVTSSQAVTTTQATVTTQITTTTQATTTQAATSTQVTTTTALPLTQPTTIFTERQRNYRQFPNFYLKSQRDQNILASVLKSAMNDYSNIIVRTPDKVNNGNNRYMYTPLRKTKPTWMPKFGIVPISDNMVQRLMTQIRGIQGIRRRPKRGVIFETR